MENWRIPQGSDFREELDQCRLNINVLESMNDWVRVIDKAGNILFMNKIMEDFTNVKALEYRCSFEEDIISDKTLIPRSTSLTTLVTGKTMTSEIGFLSREYSVTSSPIVDSRGSTFAAVEVFRDITSELSIRKELFNANMRMRDDIDFAKTIQKQLLPRKKTYHNLDISYYYRPSEDLSGDLFGVNVLDDDKVGVFISDVVGHGVSAALLTMFLRQNISALVGEGYGIYPNLLLTKLKENFGDLGLAPSIYATVFYGYYSKSKGTLTYANGGHNCQPILIRDGRATHIEASGFPISDLFLAVDYREGKVKVKKGDKLVFYTDGVIETKNHEGNQYGLDRFIDILVKNDGQIEEAVRDVYNYSWDGPEDDIAILLINVN